MHGAVRIVVGGVPEFGIYLETVGLKNGFFIAATITFCEMSGGLFLLFGKRLKWAIAFFLAELLTGIILVHGPEGWFVVGYGRNGSEYSVLLIFSLLLIWANEYLPAQKRSQAEAS